MDPFSIGALIVIGTVIVGGSFIGSSISNLAFKDNMAQITSDIKNDIHVMSMDIKGISVMEVVSIIVFVFAAIIGIVVTAIILKKCKKPSEHNREDISLREIEEGN